MRGQVTTIENATSMQIGILIVTILYNGTIFETGQSIKYSNDYLSNNYITDI